MRRLIVPVLAVIAGCRGSAPAGPEAAPEFLVWSAGEGGVTTRWLDGDGHERGRTRGIVVAAGGTAWRVEQASHRRTTTGCAMGDEDATPGSATLTDLVATTADARTRVVVVRPEASAGDGYQDYDHGVAVMAGLGPRLFGVESVSGYACGAHGGVDDQAFEFDLNQRVHRAITPRVAPDVLGPKIRAAFERAAIEGLEIDSPFKVAESVPVWSDGALTARHLVIIDTCYACGNGEWSSYTSGLWIDDVRIPDEWRAAAGAIPAPVIAAIGNPGATPTGVSWGVADDAWRALFAPPPARP